MCMHVSTVGSGLGWVVNVPHPAVGVVPQPTHPDTLGVRGASGRWRRRGGWAPQDDGQRATWAPGRLFAHGMGKG